jgi:hypothetical protein
MEIDPINEELAFMEEDMKQFERHHPDEGVYRGTLRSASLVDYRGIAGMTFELFTPYRRGKTFLVKSTFNSEPGGSLWRVLRHWKRYDPEEIKTLQAAQDPRLLLSFVGQEADVLVHNYCADMPEHITFIADLAPPATYVRQRKNGEWYIRDRDWLLYPRLELLAFWPD